MANSKIIISQNVFGTTISTGFQCIHFQHTQSRGSSKWRKTTFGRNWALCFSVSKNKQVRLKFNLVKCIFSTKIFFYCDNFSQYVLKHDAIDDKENDTLTFTLKKTWIFKPELSNGLTGDEMVTILHPGIKCLKVLESAFNRISYDFM